MTARRTFLRNLTVVAAVSAIRPATSLFAHEDGQNALRPATKTLAQLDAAGFRRCHGTAFQVRDAGDGARSLVLTEVKVREQKARRAALGRAPRLESFQVKFQGPSGAPLAERIYRISHPELGEFDLFIQPRRVVGESRFYSADFCRLV